jgi:hypothetical protein
MKETYADEGWRTNYWHRVHIAASIKANQNLEWYFQLLAIIIHDNPGQKECKSDIAVSKLDQLDIKTESKIWGSLQDVLIIIIEPKTYIKEFGVRLAANYSFVLNNQGKELIIRRDDKEIYNFVDDMLKEEISNQILFASPIMPINYAITQLPISYGNDDFFTPENLLSMISSKDSRKKIMGTIMLAARLFVAFFEMIDPNSMMNILNQFIEYDQILLFPRYHAHLLKETLSSHRYFCSGDFQSLEIIKSCVNEIEKRLSYVYDEETMPHPEVEAVDKRVNSEKNIYIQAADWAIGIARDIYEKGGVEGVKKKFKYVIFNGETIFG